MGPRQGKVGTKRQMRNERPVIVLVFAILNIVFGGLGIICSFCSGTSVGLAAGMMSAAGSTMPLTPIPSSLLTISIVEYAIGFILSAILTVSGIGLLGMNPWARRLSVAVSALGIAYALSWSTINIGYVNPAMQKWQTEFQEQLSREQRKQGLQPTANVYQSFQSPAMNIAMNVLSAMLIVGYAVALIVVMFLPHVSAAFAGRRVHQRTDWDRDPADEMNP